MYRDQLHYLSGFVTTLHLQKQVLWMNPRLIAAENHAIIAYPDKRIHKADMRGLTFKFNIPSHVIYP